MRKLILVAALVLVSASAQAWGHEKPDAGIERSNGDRSAAQRRRGAASCRKAVATTTEQPRLQQSQRMQQSQGLQQGQRMQRPGPITAAKYAVAMKVEQLKRQGASTLAHVRYALQSARHLLVRRRFVTRASFPAKAVCLAQTA